MNYCQFRNQTIKRMANVGGGGLPSMYQQVEWLKSNNTSSSNYGTNWLHIDTGVSYFADFEIDCYKTENSGLVVAGCGIYSSSGEWGATIGRYSASEPYMTFWQSYAQSYRTNVLITTRGKYAWRNNAIYVNDTYVTTYTKPNSTRNFFLFGYTGQYQYGYSNIVMYSARLWDNNGVIIRDYIPCYRKSDNTPGMYDLVTSTFNPGTGTSGYFTVGNNV